MLCTLLDNLFKIITISTCGRQFPLILKIRLRFRGLKSCSHCHTIGIPSLIGLRTIKLRQSQTFALFLALSSLPCLSTLLLNKLCQIFMNIDISFKKKIQLKNHLHRRGSIRSQKSSACFMHQETPQRCHHGHHCRSRATPLPNLPRSPPSPDLS